MMQNVVKMVQNQAYSVLPRTEAGVKMVQNEACSTLINTNHHRWRTPMNMPITNQYLLMIDSTQCIIIIMFIKGCMTILVVIKHGNTQGLL